MKHQFKTNINCSGCIEKVKPHLDRQSDISHWEVDTTQPDKILTVETENLKDADIINLVKSAGYKIEPIH